MDYSKFKVLYLIAFWTAFSHFVLKGDSLQDSLEKYPKNYFHSPLEIPLRVISNFGSFRDNHFHSGLDLSTGGKIGLRVLASQKGYVSRIKIQSGGYGKVLYITHPNGFVSVYAHLSRFAPKIESWIRAVQYKAQEFELDVHPSKNEIPMEDREWIAYSGNTGNSGGPHLHFEIRDELSEDIINPLAFGLPIQDHSAPLIQDLVLYKIEPGREMKNIMVGIFPVKRLKNGTYLPPRFPVLSKSYSYFLGVVSDDYSSSSYGPGNVYSIKLRRDGNTIFSSTLLRFGFEQTRSINSFLDYESFKFHHRKIQRSYIDPGNPLPIYSPKENLAILKSDFPIKMNMEYRLEDFFGNFTRLNFSLNFGSGLEMLPQSILPGQKVIPYSSSYTVKLEDASLFFPPNSLFDTLIWQEPIHNAFTYKLGDPQIPIKDSLLLSWSIPKGFLSQKEKIYIRKGNRATHFWIHQDSVQTWINDFGSYTLDLDTMAPYLEWLGIKNGSKWRPGAPIYLRFGDIESGIKTYQAYLNNAWILMEWDEKSHTGKIQLPEEKLNGKQNLKIILTDRTGNIKQEEQNFYF